MADAEAVKNQGGRPTRYTPGMADRARKNLRAGLTIIACCSMLGIDRKTWDNWKNRGEDREEPYREFFLSVQQGLAEHQAKHAINLEKHALGHEEEGIAPDPNLSLKILERRHRGDYGAQPTTVVNASAQAGAIATAEGARAASDGDLSERLNELRAKHGGDDV